MYRGFRPFAMKGQQTPGAPEGASLAGAVIDIARSAPIHFISGM